VKQLRTLPSFKPFESSPELVRVLDAIRFGPLDDRDEHAEFTWFIREYPRAYRHHLDHAEHRLKSILAEYEREHSVALQRIRNRALDDEWYEMAISTRGKRRPPPQAIYWDFESYLNAISSALDIAARVAGTAYRQETPPNFNRFCKKAPGGAVKEIFVRAQRRWVKRLKAYRDCFSHYTPVDTLLFLVLREYNDEWQLRAKLPVNPNIRDILAFRYSKRVELLAYSTSVWRHLRAFDRALAREIRRMYQAGEYPQRTTNLFFVGQRSE